MATVLRALKLTTFTSLCAAVAFWAAGALGVQPLSAQNPCFHIACGSLGQGCVTAPFHNCESAGLWCEQEQCDPV